MGKRKFLRGKKSQRVSKTVAVKSMKSTTHIARRVKECKRKIASDQSALGSCSKEKQKA